MMGNYKAAKHMEEDRVLVAYFEEIKKYRLLTAADEIELGRTIAEAGPDTELAKHALVTANLRLVVSLATPYSHKFGVPLADLIQEGNTGLMRAAAKFDYRRGCKFSTYATWWVRQGMTRYIYDNLPTTMIRIPVYKVEAFNKVRYVETGFIQRHNREPTFEELTEAVSREFEISEKNAKRMLQQRHDVLVTRSLDAAIGEDGNSTLCDVLSAEDIPEVGREAGRLIGNPLNGHGTLEEAERRTYLEEALACLTVRQEAIIRMRYAIGHPKVYSLQDIGDKLNLTREGIRQIELIALRKLRDRHRRKSLDALIYSRFESKIKE